MRKQVRVNRRSLAAVGVKLVDRGGSTWSASHADAFGGLNAG